jgi:hypothetical protein
MGLRLAPPLARHGNQRKGRYDGEARKVTAYTLSSSLMDRVMRQDPESVKADEVLRLGDGGIMVVPNAVGARLQAERG